MGMRPVVNMAVTSFLETCRLGGKPRIEILDHSVFLGRLEPVFVYLAGEYQLRPTTAGAIGIHDVFCAADSPTRLAVPHLLTPLDFRLERAIEPIRNPRMALVDAESDPPEFRPVPITPPKYLFDLLTEAVLGLRDGPIAQVERGYDPRLGPQGSLPGGQLTPAQHRFVDKIWKGWARPRLVAAGYWAIANVGEP